MNATRDYELRAPRRHDFVRVGDELPARLYVEDLARIFGVSEARVYQLVKKGRFDRFEIRPLIGRKAWSGKLVTAYLNGEAGSSRFVIK